MASGKNLLKTSLTEPKIQCLINPHLNNNLFSINIYMYNPNSEIATLGTACGLMPYGVSGKFYSG